AGMSKPFQELVEEVRKYAEEGYRAVKIRIGHEDPRPDIELVRELRNAVGDEIDLMVDAGQCYVDFPWDFNTALKVARELEKCNIFWLEEPLHPDDIEGYRCLSQAVDVPIAAGENEFTRFGFKELIVNRAVDILQPDVTRSGGISECKKIAAMASAFHLRCAPHIFGSGVSFMANMHFIASTPNAFIMEYDRTPNPLREELLVEPPCFSAGYVYLPKNVPGLGIRLTDEILKRFAFQESDAVLKQDFVPLW
ncbi:MAG: mandelate racemase/muconate lactonizing enzyme family protein, partial [candidate division WOR-3 bacterium]